MKINDFSKNFTKQISVSTNKNRLKNKERILQNNRGKTIQYFLIKLTKTQIFKTCKYFSVFMKKED